MNAADISVCIGIWKRPAILIDADRTLLSQQVDRCTKPAAPPCKLCDSSLVNGRNAEVPLLGCYNRGSF